MTQIDIPIKIPDTVKYADFGLHIQQTRETNRIIFRDDVIALILNNSAIDIGLYPESVHPFIKMAIIAAAYMEHLNHGGIHDTAGEYVLFTLQATAEEAPRTLN